MSLQICPNGALHVSPGQSEAPPWVIYSSINKALKGRHNSRWSCPTNNCFAPSGLLCLYGLETQGGASLRPGLICKSPFRAGRCKTCYDRNVELPQAIRSNVPRLQPMQASRVKWQLFRFDQHATILSPWRGLHHETWTSTISNDASFARLIHMFMLYLRMQLEVRGRSKESKLALRDYDSR